MSNAFIFVLFPLSLGVAEGVVFLYRLSVVSAIFRYTLMDLNFVTGVSWDKDELIRF